MSFFNQRSLQPHCHLLSARRISRPGTMSDRSSFRLMYVIPLSRMFSPLRLCKSVNSPDEMLVGRFPSRFSSSKFGISRNTLTSKVVMPFKLRSNDSMAVKLFSHVQKDFPAGKELLLSDKWVNLLPSTWTGMSVTSLSTRVSPELYARCRKCGRSMNHGSEVSKETLVFIIDNVRSSVNTGNPPTVPSCGRVRKRTCNPGRDTVPSTSVTGLFSKYNFLRLVRSENLQMVYPKISSLYIFGL